MPSIEFNNEYVLTSTLEVESIGNVCIEAIDESKDLHYYLLIKTEYGVSSVFEYGPISPGITLLCKNYYVSFRRLNYNYNKLINIIKEWLNKKDRRINVANLIEEKTFVDNYKDIIYTIENYGKGVY